MIPVVIPPDLWEGDVEGAVSAWLFADGDRVRSGDLIAIADAKSWFTYYYWMDDAKAPDFARCVDIHRKCGYDPAELAFASASDGLAYHCRLGAQGWSAPVGVGGNNVARWCDKGYDDRVVRAKRTPDVQVRETLYREAQQIFHDQEPWVPIAHSVVFMATRAEVTGFVIDPLGRHPFDGVDVKER